MQLSDMDVKYARLAIASGKATDEEIAFLDTMLSLEAAREPTSSTEYARLQRLTGGNLSSEPPIHMR